MDGTSQTTYQEDVAMSTHYLFNFYKIMKNKSNLRSSKAKTSLIRWVVFNINANWRITYNFKLRTLFVFVPRAVYDVSISIAVGTTQLHPWKNAE